MFSASYLRVATLASHIPVVLLALGACEPAVRPHEPTAAYLWDDPIASLEGLHLWRDFIHATAWLADDP